MTSSPSLRGCSGLQVCRGLLQTPTEDDDSEYNNTSSLVRPVINNIGHQLTFKIRFYKSTTQTLIYLHF